MTLADPFSACRAKHEEARNLAPVISDFAQLANRELRSDGGIHVVGNIVAPCIHENGATVIGDKLRLPALELAIWMQLADISHAARTQHACDLREHRRELLDVLEHEIERNDVRTRIIEWPSISNVVLDKPDVLRGDTLSRLREHARGEIDRDDRLRMLREPLRILAGTCADLDDIAPNDIECLAQHTCVEVARRIVHVVVRSRPIVVGRRYIVAHGDDATASMNA